MHQFDVTLLWVTLKVISDNHEVASINLNFIIINVLPVASNYIKLLQSSGLFCFNGVRKDGFLDCLVTFYFPPLALQEGRV